MFPVTDKFKVRQVMTLIEGEIEKRQYELQHDLIQQQDFVEILSEDVERILFGEPE